MLLSRQDETELLTALHGDLANDSGWFQFVSRLRSRIRADYVGIFLSEPNGAPRPRTEVSKGSLPTVSETGTALLRELPDASLTIRGSRVYDIEEFADRAINRELKPRSRHLRFVRVSEGGCEDLWLLAARSIEPFDASISAILSALVPHLAIALKNRLLLDTMLTRVAISEEALGRLGLAWILFDAQGRVRATSEVAQRLFGLADDIQCTVGHRLQLASTAGEEAMATAFGQLETNEQGSRAITLSDASGLTILLARHPAHHERHREPLIVGYVRKENCLSPEAQNDLRTLYRLSHKESKLVIALCRGRSIADAADEIGLTIETARHYSKRIYAKTGTRSQVDLVRLVLGGVAPLSVGTGSTSGAGRCRELAG